MAFGRKFKKLEESRVLEKVDRERLHDSGIDTVEEFVSAVQADDEAVAKILAKDSEELRDIFARTLDEVDPELKKAAQQPLEKYALGPLAPESDVDPIDYPRSIRLEYHAEDQDTPSYVITKYRS